MIGPADEPERFGAYRTGPRNQKEHKTFQGSHNYTGILVVVVQGNRIRKDKKINKKSAVLF